ncbi:MAG: GNAT family N-acetyltransferase [Muribaculaceae bacterium]|nr:GNAT family N-acetyltransferase [Roseburia sp.]MCM1431449.1 GNAT family N-acetyltransferase [Muribaculaceae bacterium]MCM1493257.1 GNAT family N-acetyltransferase [Muribaculaceae bacterium]
MVTAREFTEQDKAQLLAMVAEIKQCDANFEGLNDIENIGDYSLFLDKLEKWKHQERIPADYSPQTIFGVFDEGRLAGGFVLRHVLKSALINHSGNIGYLVRPAERKKGYGKILLMLALEKAGEKGLEKVLVTCRNDNTGSIKVIESCGGKYENDYYDEGADITYKRYWIACE